MQFRQAKANRPFSAPNSTLYTCSLLVIVIWPNRLHAFWHHLAQRAEQNSHSYRLNRRFIPAHFLLPTYVQSVADILAPFRKRPAHIRRSLCVERRCIVSFYAEVARRDTETRLRVMKSCHDRHRHSPRPYTIKTPITPQSGRIRWSRRWVHRC